MKVGHKLTSLRNKGEEGQRNCVYYYRRCAVAESQVQNFTPQTFRVVCL